MSRPHSVLGKRIAPRVGFAPSKPTRSALGYHIPSAGPIKRAFAGWRSRLPLNSAAYYQPEMVSGYNGDKQGRAA